MIELQKDGFGSEMDRRLLLRVDEVARMIGVSKATAYDLIARNELPSIKLQGRGLLRVPAEKLRKLIEDRSAGK